MTDNRIVVTYYEKTTGEFAQSMTFYTPGLQQALPYIEENCAPEWGWVQGKYSRSEHFVQDGEVVPKPPQPGLWAVWENGEWADSRTPESDARDLHDTQAAHIDRVNRTCGLIRVRFVTDIPFQDTTYAAKREEAISYLKETDPDLTDYPYLRREIGITADTAYELCQVWLNMALITHDLNAELESLRVDTNNRIGRAAAIEEVVQIYDSFVAAVEEFG